MIALLRFYLWSGSRKLRGRFLRCDGGGSLEPTLVGPIAFHIHSTSDLMFYAVEGSGTLDVDGSPVAFDEGSLAFFGDGEVLRLSNNSTSGLTAHAFLAPPFPPRSD